MNKHRQDQIYKNQGLDRAERIPDGTPAVVTDYGICVKGILSNPEETGDCYIGGCINGFKVPVGARIKPVKDL